MSVLLAFSQPDVCAYFIFIFRPVVGQQVTAMTRRALDLAGEGVPIDSAPLLLIPALLVQHNKANSRVRCSNVSSTLLTIRILRKC